MSKNYRNGYSKKSVKTQLGEVDVKIPRDRNGEYEPKIIAKYDRNAAGMEEKILGLYACGMSQHDISDQIKSLYDVEISPELVSKISEKIMPEVTAWQNRPLLSLLCSASVTIEAVSTDARLKRSTTGMYVTWQCKNGTDYYWGHYTENRYAALKDLCERA